MESFGTATRLLVDEADSLFLAFSESSVGVLNCKGDMVHATLATILLNEGGDGAFGTGGLKELDFHVTNFEKSGFDFLVRNLLNGVAFEAHYIFPVLDGFVEIGNGDADVLYVRRCHFFDVFYYYFINLFQKSMHKKVIFYIKESEMQNINKNQYETKLQQKNGLTKKNIAKSFNN